MAVDLMGGWGNSAGGSFWDDEPNGDTGGGKDEYVQVTTQSDGGNAGETELAKMPNPFDTFEREEDVKYIDRKYNL